MTMKTSFKTLNSRCFLTLHFFRRSQSRRRLSSSSEERRGEHGERWGLSIQVEDQVFLLPSSPDRCVSRFSCRGAPEGSAGADWLQEETGAGVSRSKGHVTLSRLPWVSSPPLKGSFSFCLSTAPPTCSSTFVSFILHQLLLLFSPDNFQDQMKRELAYREEMVQQLQMVRLTMMQNTDRNWVHVNKNNKS